MFYLQEIQKKTEGIAFREELDLKKDLMERSRDILDVSSIFAEGKVSYEAGLYFLDYQLTYTITLASSRSMLPVLQEKSYLVTEVFSEGEENIRDNDWIDEALILVAEAGVIDLEDSVADNILLNIPLKILTPEEEEGKELPLGDNWSVLTEEDYEQTIKEKKEENSPFAQLQGLFDED